MSIRNQLDELLHEAMRNHDDLIRNTIRLILSSIKQVEIEKRTILDDQEIIKVLQKELKIRKETVEDMRSAGRKDLEESALAEMKIIEKILPTQLEDIEISDILKKIIEEVGATSPSDLGKVMKLALPLMAGRASPDRISSIARQFLI